MTPEDFAHRWRGLVDRWRAATPGTAAARDVLADALANGLPAGVPDPGSADGTSTKEDLRCQIALIRLSGDFDGPGYDRANRLRGRVDPIRHFCLTGWRDFANPSLEFDVWWYWFTAIGLDRDDVNPLVHYLLVGRREGLPGLPPDVAPVAHGQPPGGEPVRRAFLFAGYDVDRVVDPYVVSYLAELARHGDVFYLADNPLSDAELDKVRPHTAGCWAIHHGKYDFGSYAMLARDLVGWDRLDAYDEVVLANDSCYLLRPLDDVLEEMDARPCDWWGLQASKRDFDRARGHRRPIPMDQAKRELVGAPEWHQLMFLHISSYFVVLRRPAFTDPGFRRLMEQVTSQRRKDDIIFKYELGMSRQLLAAGHEMATYIDDLYPFHPVYTHDHFELVARGFPLLKRSFLIENTERTPDLARWRERVLEHVPRAPVEEIEHNLWRVGADDALRASFAITSEPNPDGALDPTRLSLNRLRREDRRAPQHDHWWAFVVDSQTHQLSSDARAVFGVVADDPSIKKVILTRSRAVALPGRNVESHPLTSVTGLELLLRCRQVFVAGEPRTEVPFALSLRGHNVVHAGHPHPLRVFGAALGPAELERAAETNRIRFRGVVTGSRLSSMSVASGLYPTPANAMWPLGCPRHDLVLGDPAELPPDLRSQYDAARDLIAGRRVLLWTWGANDRRDRPFTDAEVAALGTWAQRTRTAILAREDRADRRRRHADALADVGAVELTHREFPHLEVLYSLADAMVTDDSPHVVDFLLTGRPVLMWSSLPPGRAPSWLTDPSLLLPGPVCSSFADLTDGLERLWDDPSRAAVQRYEQMRELLIERADARSAWRVAQQVRALRTEEVDYDQLAADRRRRARQRRLGSTA